MMEIAKEYAERVERAETFADIKALARELDRRKTPLPDACAILPLVLSKSKAILDRERRETAESVRKAYAEGGCNEVWLWPSEGETTS